MLLVNAKAGTSQIHRMGLIAQEFIPKQNKVWQFMPGFDVLISETFMARLSPIAREQVIYWGYYNSKTRTFVLSSDDDRFMNHSDEPNTYLVEDCVVAARDIHPGDEITCDYVKLVVLNVPALNDHCA